MHLSLVPAPQDSDAFEGFAMSMPLAPVEPVNLVSHELRTNESSHPDCLDVPLINARDKQASK